MVIAAVLLIAAAGIVTLLTNRSDKPTDQTLAVTLPENTTVDIYKVSESEEHGTGSGELGQPVASFTKNEERRLPRGEYLATLRETADYKPYTQRFALESTKFELTVSPDYKEQKLAAALPAEKSAILAALTAAYPQLTSLYTVQEGWLYKQGNWYATKLTAKSGSATQGDTLRLVMHKENNAWKVITNPPDITISGPRYPMIPIEILTDINNFK